MINKEVKGQLAKLLATENITVEHRKVSTASFDVESRVLTLPLWETASQDIYDLLVGHEVGHALYTPADAWEEEIENKDLPKFFVNVTEDARIEKLMKRKYPGLSANFYRGYQQLHSEDFFGVTEEDPEDISFIDRVNLHFKIGIHAFSKLHFTEEEKYYVGLVEKAETFSEAVYAAREIFKYAKELQEKTETLQIAPEDIQEAEFIPHPTGQETIEQDGPKEDSNDQNNTAPLNSDSSEGADSHNDTSNKSNSTNKKNELESRTDEAWTKNQEKLLSTAQFSPNYINLPEVDVNNVIIDNKSLYEELEKWYVNYFTSTNITNNPYAYKIEYIRQCQEESFNEYKNYRNESQKEVNYLVKEFEMKKSADQYNRSSVSRTGVLDTTKLHSYRYNEDVFKRVTVLPGSKNHGMIFMLDWSGSMASDILACIRQILNLCWFCRKVSIPFEVYAFTEASSTSIFQKTHGIHSEPKEGNVYFDPTFRLLHLLSSKTNNKEFDNQAKWLFYIGRCMSGLGSYCYPDFIGLSNTPLNEAVICYNGLVTTFQKKYKVQKLSIITLTDGDSSRLAFYKNSSDNYYGTSFRHANGYCIFRNPKTGRSYPISGHDDHLVTKQLLHNTKDSFPNVNLIGIRIIHSTHARHYINRFVPYEADVAKKWTKDKCYVIKNSGYDSLYVIPNGNYLSEEVEFDVEAGASKSQIRTAFRKMLKKKTLNKKFLTTFIENIA